MENRRVFQLTQIVMNQLKRREEAVWNKLRKRRQLEKKIARKQ